MIDWHIGCSGFHYTHWKNTFYPEGLAQRRWFEYYASHFKTLELNVTFYRFPKLSFLQNWYDISPDDFQFSVKAPRAITHFKQFHGTVDMLSDFYGTLKAGLQEKLGPVLFQLPPRLAYQEERLERILSQLDFNYKNVLEFRHASWWNPLVYERLAEAGVTFCGMSHPELPAQLVANTDTVYYRFHGVPNLYSSAYGEEALKKFLVEARSADIKEAWCYFNNDAAVAAIPDAQTLIRFTGSE
ncbi:DUF72 domain-containing protein [Mucilaginibacter ginsenosidivorax]|uniref:DUF72 domain-containing protein n=1 Tax=Mucilaginibacter ginsenosidivorax TaxID=862126 RepID=A0A5B8VT11_9SPHI|nr:DUF72 domain-containing protein [Mucilaginibacter ginsenosidivorax]QEC74737.1 DUF72 domain-containing protein [Mucilaginibacter ginsenosidivorax]